MTNRSKPFAEASSEEREELADTFTPALERADPGLRPGAMPEAVRSLLGGRSTVRRSQTRRGPVFTVMGPERPEEEGPGDRVLGCFDDPAVARVVASVLPAGAVENPFLVGDHEPRRGHPVFHDGLLLGHVTHPDRELAARLHLAYTYATTLESLAHLLEGLDTRALVFLGRMLERRLEEERGARPVK